MSDYMSYITKSNMTQRSEVLSQFDWEVKFDHIPSAVYWPGELTFQMRTRSITPPLDLSVTNDKVQLRGMTLLQPGETVNSGQLVLDLQDLADQSLVAFMVDYFYKAHNPLTHQSLAKEDLYADISLYRLNAARQAVKACRCKTCLPATGSMGDTYGNEKVPISGHSFTWDVQLYWYEILT